MKYINKIYYTNKDNYLLNYLLVYFENNVPYKVEDYHNGKLVHTRDLRSAFFANLYAFP